MMILYLSGSYIEIVWQFIGSLPQVWFWFLTLLIDLKFKTDSIFFNGCIARITSAFTQDPCGYLREGVNSRDAN